MSEDKTIGELSTEFDAKMKVIELMSNVTDAVIKAEGSIKDAISYYTKLVEAEQAIVDHPDAKEIDKDIARRGVESATIILDGLKRLLPWEPDGDRPTTTTLHVRPLPIPTCEVCEQPMTLHLRSRPGSPPGNFYACAQCDFPPNRA